MKKTLITGIILVLVMVFMGTCNDDLAEDGEIEYTDVVYSKDGSQITLYLDGVGVPVTRAQRAVNRELAMMAYDYFEVIFMETATSTETGIARAQWELGQLAGIYNVPRGSAAQGLPYGFDSTTSKAAMFVGKKSDKTLLGIGYLSNSSPAIANPSTPPPPTLTTNINSSTKSVTFSISAIQTGLIVGGETAGSGTAAGVAISSFVFTGGTLGGATGWGSLTTTNSIRESVNGSPLKYPRYSLPDTAGTVTANYIFSYIGTNNVFTLAYMYGSTADNKPALRKRVPRFMSGGRYMEPKDGWTTTTTIDFGSGWVPSDNTTSFSGKATVPIVFTTNGGTGVFSFYIEIPVYMLTVNKGGFQITDATKYIDPITWYIRTGVGSELYSLDDGIANGGCVFMSVGASAANWIDIEWQWL